ncbi:acyltransferase [Leifsonia sp. ZF2019]|uniref:acyltransferase family protein n=1 Tax=Leifsonia sp. ZF2019 TaxID=2781978 RepID=UPI001CBCF9E8|nr:acyltransferase [Leifsonia sp. ZF2019]UAJ80063.1 acyltransferase [Leifsonia sp. ZF2019]
MTYSTEHASRVTPATPAISARRRGGLGQLVAAGSIAGVTGHRVEITALRVFAIGAVVTYHYWPEALPGGFVGVDVFFVISGFLITTHLLRQIDAEGRINLRSFWMRRAARLLPSALTVIAVVAVLTPILVPVADRHQTAVQQVSSLFFVQNWALVFQSVDYLTAGAPPTALEHFWSLSTEEQFYVILPLVFCAVIAAAGIVRVSRGRLFLLLGALAGASFALSVVLSVTDPAGAYFNTGVRVWEFLAGAALCFLPRPNTRLGPWLAVSGAALLVLSVLFITPSMAFPGWVALAPVSGATLFIAAGARSLGPALTKVCSNRVAGYVAIRSYAIYLWHWPVLILAPLLVATFTSALPVPASPLLLVAALGVSLILAELTHRFVERRFWGANA